MNKILTQEIIKHILSTLLVIPSDFVSSDSYQSLCSKKYLLKENLTFTSEDNITVKNKIWGCSFSLLQEEVKILVGDCSQDSDIIEYSVIIYITNAPTYGLYIVFDPLEIRPLIACIIDSKSWMPCNMFLQATFLAGMEQIKDLFITSTSLSNYQDQYKMMLSLINYYNSLEQ